MTENTGNTPPHRPQTAAEKLHHAENTCAELSAALRRAGIVLPSLRVEVLAYGDKMPRPLIELGCCNLDTAHKLADVLTASQERGR